jgi:hypothetical protein
VNDNGRKIDTQYINPLNTSSPEAEERQREIRIAHQPLNWGRAVADFTRVCEQTGLIDKLRKDEK